MSYPSEDEMTKVLQSLPGYAVLPEIRRALRGAQVRDACAVNRGIRPPALVDWPGHSGPPAAVSSSVVLAVGLATATV